jgi:phosphodiesterase/alkaline phosphatase D-like protein
MERVPLFVSGDIHSIAEERILRSGEHDFSANPVVTVVTGSPGVGVAWPSIARGTVATPPAHLEVEEVVPVIEENGFQIVDFEPGKVTIRHFRWDRSEQPEDAIDTLEPFHVSEYRP